MVLVKIVSLYVCIIANTWVFTVCVDAIFQNGAICSTLSYDSKQVDQ